MEMPLERMLSSRLPRVEHKAGAKKSPQSRWSIYTKAELQILVEQNRIKPIH
jgi:hypothetical protein